MGIVAGENLTKVLKSFTDGFGSTAAGVGILIALGAMFAKLLADSGGADEIVDTIVGHASPRTLPWAMALVGAIIGLPMFFEIGLVLLMPVIYLVSRRSQLSLITVGIPALAGLSAMHGFVPPHPGPLTAIGLLNADLGITLALGVVGGDSDDHRRGPVVREAGRAWVVVEAPDTFDADRFAEGTEHRTPVIRRHAVPRAAARRADARQGARRHLHRRRGPVVPADLRHPRHPADRAADRGDRRHVHARPRRRDDPRRDHQVQSNPVCPRWPASS